MSIQYIVLRFKHMTFSTWVHLITTRPGLLPNFAKFFESDALKLECFPWYLHGHEFWSCFRMTGLCHDGAIAFEDKHERGETFSSVYEIKVGLLKKKI